MQACACHGTIASPVGALGSPAPTSKDTSAEPLPTGPVPRPQVALWTPITRPAGLVSRVALPATISIQLARDGETTQSPARFTGHHVLIDIARPATAATRHTPLCGDYTFTEAVLATLRQDIVTPTCLQSSLLARYVPCQLFFTGQRVYFGGHFPVPAASADIHELKLVQPIELGFLEPGNYTLKATIVISGLSLTLNLHSLLIGMAPISCDPNKILDQPDDVRNYESKDDSNIAGRMFLPKDLAAFKGTVLIANGQGGGKFQKDLFKAGWEYLLPCLASNGFIAVAIRSTTSIEKRVTQLKGNINFLVKKIKEEHKIDITTKPLALVGASEAGTSAAIVANNMAGLPFTSCMAVVGLAPTYHPESYGSSFTPNFLALVGTHDGEVTDDRGGKMFDHVTKASFRCHVWIHGATHHQFMVSGLKDSSFAENPLYPKVKTAIARDTQVIVAKNYITMFLLWRLAGQKVFEPLFLGDAELNVAADPASNDTVKNDVTSGRLQMRPRYRRNTEDPQMVCMANECYVFNNFLVGLAETPNPSFKPLNSFSSDIVCAADGFNVQWVRSLKPSPSITINPPPGLMLLAPPIFDLDMVLTGFALNLSSSASFAVKILTSDGKIRIKDNFLVPNSLNIWTIFNNIKLTNISQFVPSVVRIHFNSFGMLPGDISKITKVVLDFSASSNGVGTVGLTGVRFAFV